eukprot:5069123-Amphidinium_carterae.1
MMHSRVKHSGPYPTFARLVPIEDYYVIAGTPCLDGSWKHIKRHMQHARRTSVLFDSHVRWGQFQYWITAAGDKFAALSEVCSMVDQWGPLLPEPED